MRVPVTSLWRPAAVFLCVVCGTAAGCNTAPSEGDNSPGRTTGDSGSDTASPEINATNSGATDSGATDSVATPVTVTVATELTSRWAKLPHRWSKLEIASRVEPAGLTLTGQNDGGPWGQIDSVTNLHSFVEYSAPGLVAAATSTTLSIAPVGPAKAGDPAAYTARGAVTLPAAAWTGATGLTAWISGFRLSTDEYAAPPPFATASENAYPPDQGYTTQGLGIALGTPAIDGDRVVVPVTVRNSLGLSDRVDMNAAIPQATTWIRVDVQVVGFNGAATQPTATVTRGTAAYVLNNPTYGTGTEHVRATGAQQKVVLTGQPTGTTGAGALFGLSAFDVWVNAVGYSDPACKIIQSASAGAMEGVEGPGRYVTELSARLHSTVFEAATGRGEASVDLYFSNRSAFREEGNLCLAMRGEVAMLQVPVPVQARPLGPFELPLDRGVRTSKTLKR